MAGDEGTSASAGSSGGGSSPPGSSTADGRPRVDFYVIEGTAPATRLRVACRLAEKAYLASQRALVWHADRAELQAFDEMLWTFADGSFVPHDWLTSNGGGESPVLLSAGEAPAATVDFVINLAPEPPPFLDLTRRIAEIVDGEEGRRRAGRMRFKAYRELGIEPATHALRAE